MWEVDVKRRVTMAAEIVTVKTRAVSCEGDSAVTGHPRVYLTFKPGANQIVCPYCSRTFVLTEDTQAEEQH
jgi:uncharacterized Zn-finger protein